MGCWMIEWTSFPFRLFGKQSKMKFFVVFALLAAAACAVAENLPSSEYLPPVQDIGIPSNEYLAPIEIGAPLAQYSSGVLADDGYRYKTVKRFRSRHRRDVSELPSNEYLPPFQQDSYAPISTYPTPSNEYLAPIAPAAPIVDYSSGVLADDGYRYKTVKRFRTAKRFRSRHRRDVNELPSNEYLPPFQQDSYAPISSYPTPSNEYLAPFAPASPIVDYSSGVLADDGYRYKTVKRFRTAKRFRSRHRRDVNELPSNEYLPPFQQDSYAPISSYPTPSNEYLAPFAPASPIVDYSSGVLADDGYRYKTVKRFRTAKRFRSRHRRDVSELPSNEYLPPFQQEAYGPISSFAAPSNEYLAPIAPAAPFAQYSSGVLADDGYRYKTVKRFRTARRYRSRH
ncbi:uncharacterized protein LOC129939032 [Eupeodes corollae]|uniref:uncharacterized protein LOC129939032 n=1 Tax=Eupeodes corollae TaxID=290404 RepID=UPI002492BC47|nr:uncharacterized protein LOC129939032 [Eupeodes corollae]